MRNEIENYIRTCKACQEKKLDRAKTRTPLVLTDTPINPFEKVSMDTVGLLRTTPRGNQHLLTIQCNLTKYLLAIPVRDITATTIAEALCTHLICQFGAPLAILSDNGKSFTSGLIREMLRIFRVSQLFTSPYYPATNGQLERSHACVADYIRTLSDRFDDWDRLAPFAAFAYNTSVHSATNFTPFELVYGRIARFPLRIPSEDKLCTYNVYLRDLITRLTELHVIAGKNIIKNKEKCKERFDKKAKPVKFKVGDHVRSLVEPRRSKTDDIHKQSGTIIEILGNKNYLLQLPDGTKIIKHANKIKLAPKRPSSSSPASD